MGINAINSINAFQKPFGMNVHSAGAFQPSNSVSIFGGQNQNNNQKSAPIDFNSSIFGQIDNIKSASGLNPFSKVNEASKVSGISPVNAKQNYMNGLAPSDNLQNVYAGMLNGKANILNQIAIA